MASYSHDVTDNIGGGIGGMGGGWLIGALIIFVLIFKDGFLGGHRGGHEGHGGDRGRERNWFPDESNYQLGRELDNHMCMIEKTVNARADKTDGIITNNVIQDLRDKNTAKDAKILQLESEAFNGAKFSAIERMIELLALRTPQAEPQYVATRGHCLAERPSCGEPRRGGCDFN